MTSYDICKTLSDINLKEHKTLPARVLQSVESGELSAGEALRDGLMKGMDTIGEGFKDGRIYLPEVMITAKTMNACVRLLKPYLAESGDGSLGTAVIGTVKGDNHDIGKNIVRIMLEGKGIKVVDLGTNIEPSVFVKRALEENAGLICASALLTTTMPVMGDICALAKQENIPVLVGGAPLNAEYAKKIGAYYAPDAAQGAEKAAELLKARNA